MGSNYHEADEQNAPDQDNPDQGNTKTQPKAARARGSSIDLHEYDEKSKSLTVTFAGGRKYRYEDVDARTAEGLANASSKGAFMRASVVGKFATTKL